MPSPRPEPPELRGTATGAGAPAVLLLHGYAATRFSWRHWVPQLSREHRVLAPDLMGFGDSPPPGDGRYDPLSHTRAVLGWAGSRVPPGSGLVLVGHSFGGIVALLAALLQAETEGTGPDIRGLVLLGCPAYPDRIPPFTRLSRFGVLSRIGLRVIPKGLMIRAVLRSIQSPSHPPGREQVRGYAEPFRRGRHRRAALATGSQLLASDPGPWIDRYPSIRVPALLVHGAFDPVAPPEMGRRLQGDLQEARCLVLPECGHIPQEEIPEQSLLPVREFIREIG